MNVLEEIILIDLIKEFLEENRIREHLEIKINENQEVEIIYG